MYNNTITEKDNRQKTQTKVVDKNEGIILDISDLHYTISLDEKIEAYLLIEDLKKVYFENPENTLKLNNIDYIVISGDFVEYGNSVESFQKSFNFINILSTELNIPYQNIIVTPGNHDLSWDITMASYHLTIGTANTNDVVVKNVGSDIFYLKRNDIEWYNKFENYSKYIYEKLYGSSFPEDPKKQLKVIQGDFIGDTKVAFFLLNTSADIDQFNREATYFDTAGLISASSQLTEKNIIKIAVGHHPVNMTNSYGNDVAFSNALQNENFKLYLHGHVHRNISLDYLNPQNINPNLIMIGAGALSVGKSGLWPGVPERYNIIKISKDCPSHQLLVTVNTRQREYIGSYWEPAYIYYREYDKMMSNLWMRTI